MLDTNPIMCSPSNVTLSPKQTSNLRELIRLLSNGADGFGSTLDGLTPKQEVQVVELVWGLQGVIET